MDSFGSSKGRDTVAFLLAVGISTAINLITFAVLYDAIFSKGPGLSDNATQILTAAFTGMFGVLGSYIGFMAAGRNGENTNVPREEATRHEARPAPGGSDT